MPTPVGRRRGVARRPGRGGRHPCSLGDALANVRGQIASTVGADDPRFAALIRQVTTDMFRTDFDGNRSGVWISGGGMGEGIGGGGGGRRHPHPEYTVVILAFVLGWLAVVADMPSYMLFEGRF